MKKNLFSNRLNIFIIILIFVIIIYSLNIKQTNIENLDNKCIPVKNTDIVDSVKCNIKANNIWINNYKRRNNICNANKCSMNNYINNLKNTDRLGNYKISMKWLQGNNWKPGVITKNIFFGSHRKLW